jgi:hypothetical protein
MGHIISISSFIKQARDKYCLFAGGCQFPRQWSGHWFQSGVPHLLTINSTSIETKGECVEGQGDKFIVEDK